MIQVLQIFIWLFLAYLLAGLLFGCWFVFKGVNKVDPGMEGAPWTLRVLLLPGSMAIWPVLIKKVLNA